LTGFYDTTLGVALRHPWKTLTLCILAASAAGALYTELDRELLPPEDRGSVVVFSRGPDGVGLSYVERQADRIENILAPLMANGEIQSLYSVVGRWDPNIVYMNAQLVPWNERERSQQAIAAELIPLLSNLPGMSTRIFSGNSLNLRGASGGGIQLALLGTDYDQIYAAAREYADAIRERLTSVTRPRVSYDPSQPQLSVHIDRQRASDLDIPLEQVSQTLRAMVDGFRVVDLNANDESVPIILEAGNDKIDDPSDLVNLYVRTNTNKLVPLSSVVELDEHGVAGQLDRRAQRRAIQIDAEIAPDIALQTALDDMLVLADEVLPPGISVITQGEAATLDETTRDTLITYGFALLIVFLVLVAQFESLASAIVIMTIVPFGLAAAVFALHLTDTSLNIYSQVGLVMLIGLIAKNGILLVEFADQLRDEGLLVKDAIAQAAHTRLRPIAMTLVSTVLGALPLILATGPGAEARMAVGWVVFGGLGMAAVFTLYLTPVIYLGVARFAKPRAAARLRLESELADL
jgi:multidrug efflux pump subunit AcrB